MKESDFYKFMQFSTELLYDRYSFYLPFFKDCDYVLDLGCGDGVFLELLAKEGKSGLGVDNDEGMVRNCKDKKLKVVQADILHFLQETDQVFDGIFCAHVVEHLTVQEAQTFVRECRSRLREKGVLLIVTPNPSCLQTHLLEFWRDPSHIRMYTKDLLAFILSYCGFDGISMGENTLNVSASHFTLPSNVDDFCKRSFLNLDSDCALSETKEKKYNIEVPRSAVPEPESKVLSPIKYIKFRAARYIESCLSILADRSSFQINRASEDLQDEISHLRHQIVELQRLQTEELRAFQCLSPYPEIYAVGCKSLE